MCSDSFAIYRWLYWTDIGTVDRILRASMDGSSMAVLHDTSLSLPYSLTMDYDSQILYWADYSLNKIEKSNADGTNRAIVTTASVRDPYSIVFYNNRLYWTDIYYDRVLTTSVSSPSVSYLTTSQGNNMYTIKAVASERQPQGTLISSRICFQVAYGYNSSNLMSGLKPRPP